MPDPITIDLPHTLGAEEARRRIERGMGRLSEQIPGGAQVESSWSGQRMNLRMQAMGQDIRSTLDVQERIIRLEVLLPPNLSFFGKGIEGLLRRQGEKLLEDKTGKRS